MQTLCKSTQYRGKPVKCFASAAAFCQALLILVKLETEACMRRSATDEVARILACQRNYYSVLKVRCLDSLCAHQAPSCLPPSDGPLHAFGQYMHHSNESLHAHTLTVHAPPSLMI